MLGYLLMLPNLIIFYRHVGDIHDYFWFRRNESIKGLSYVVHFPILHVEVFNHD